MAPSPDPWQRPFVFEGGPGWWEEDILPASVLIPSWAGPHNPHALPSQEKGWQRVPVAGELVAVQKGEAGQQQPQQHVLCRDQQLLRRLLQPAHACDGQAGEDLGPG